MEATTLAAPLARRDRAAFLPREDVPAPSEFDFGAQGSRQRPVRRRALEEPRRMPPPAHADTPAPVRPRSLRRLCTGVRNAVERLVMGRMSHLMLESGARRRMILVHVVCLVAIVNLLPLGFVAYAQGSTVVGAIDHLVGVLLLLNLIYLRRGGKFETAAFAGIALGGALFVYLFCTGGVQGTGHLWLFTFPLFACFLLGARRGAIASLGLIVPVTIHLCFDVGIAQHLYHYPPAFAVRLVPAYLVVLAYAFTFEHLRGASHRRSTTQNAQLSNLVGKLQEKERALAAAHEELEQRVRDRTGDLNHANVELLNEIGTRREAEEQLRCSHDRFTTVLDSIDADVYAADLETHEILFANRRMKETFGSDLVGEPCWRALRGRDAPCEGCRASRLIDADGNVTGPAIREGLNELTLRWYIHQDRAIRWVDGRYVRLQVATDITQRRAAEEENARLQRELQQAQKMEALGTLAGGVAHDLNNILAGVMGYPDLLLMDLPEESRLRRPLESIKASGEKCALIVQDMLTLARRGVASPSPVRVDDQIQEFLASPEFDHLRSQHLDVSIDYRPSPDRTEISATPHHLSKTLLNLMVNAFEATPPGGRVRVEARERIVGRPLRGYVTVPAGRYVVLRIEDTGCGIAPDQINRIFEPFYSTKVMGKSGSGLGMAVVWATVQDHGGYLDLRSREGEGTIFELYFPASKEPRVEEPLDEASPDIQGRGEKILVVDDVEEQRHLASMILTRLGYSVDTVAGGEDAVDYLRAHEPALMLVDMIMEPGIDGLETYQRALTVRPDQRAIIVSGYAPSERVEEALCLGVRGYVHKPYLIREIGGAVREALQ